MVASNPTFFHNSVVGNLLPIYFQNSEMFYFLYIDKNRVWMIWIHQVYFLHSTFFGCLSSSASRAVAKERTKQHKEHNAMVCFPMRCDAMRCNAGPMVHEHEGDERLTISSRADASRCEDQDIFEVFAMRQRETVGDASTQETAAAQDNPAEGKGTRRRRTHRAHNPNRKHRRTARRRCRR